MSIDKKLRILHVNMQDRSGGGEKVAYDLFRTQRRRGHESYLAVGMKTLNDPDIFEIPNDACRNPWARVWRTSQTSLINRRLHKLARLSGWLANLGELGRWYEWRRGIEDFNFPGAAHLLDLAPGKPDVIHTHNLLGAYFDLRLLAPLSQRVPVVFTLHNEWAFTGHCACVFGCNRWEVGCGSCPDIETYPAIKRDNTSYNLRRKRDIYSRSRLFVSSPSRWLLDKALRSVLRPAIVEAKVIPHGIDLGTFRPGDRKLARQRLGLPQEARVALFVANGTRSNPFKDYATMEAAVEKIAARLNLRQLIFLCLGEEGAERKIGSATFRYAGYQADPPKVAQFYQASDIYLHAAKTESFGLVVSEALACGVPVVATAVGGIPEVVEDQRAGFLIPPGDSDAMASQAIRLLEDEPMRRKMSDWAAESARRRFDLERQVDEYLEWYRELAL
jgi:glycosyltransferase involved in cell wall biosynthesis